LHSEQAPCIALEVHDGKYLCGVALRPEFYLREVSQLGQLPNLARAVVAEVLGFGRGCGMDDEVTVVRIESAA
jgi:hypothetical protein